MRTTATAHNKDKENMVMPAYIIRSYPLLRDPRYGVIVDICMDVMDCAPTLIF